MYILHCVTEYSVQLCRLCKWRIYRCMSLKYRHFKNMHLYILHMQMWHCILHSSCSVRYNDIHLQYWVVHRSVQKALHMKQKLSILFWNLLYCYILTHIHTWLVCFTPANLNTKIEKISACFIYCQLRRHLKSRYLI